MIEAIHKEKTLKKYLRNKFEDAGIEVEVDDKLEKKDYIGIKVDDYYNNIMPMTAPKSVDYIVVVDCRCSNYALYIMEFKNVKHSTGVKIKEIHEKFDTTINDFIETRYGEIFYNDTFKYKKIFLYLVADIYKEEKKGKKYPRDSLKVETTLTMKPFKIRNKLCSIQYTLPSKILIRKFL